MLGALGTRDARAHAGLALSDPVAGATLGASPKAVRLSFSEHPAPSLSAIRVVDASGAAHQIGLPRQVAGDSLSLEVPVRRLERGVYTVAWRVASAVDGHSTAGSYAFGVGVVPNVAEAAERSSSPAFSRLELLARWLFLVGVVLLVGTAAATVFRFGGPAGIPLGAAGWLLAVLGLVLLMEAQARSASASLGDLLESSVGSDLLWRAVAVGAAGVGLLYAALALGWIRRLAMAAVGVAALTAIAVHVAAGHAAAGGWPPALTVAAQWAHFAAAGVWLGGLAALLLGVRGVASEAKAAAVRRFSTIAAAGLAVVVVTGTVRAVDELASMNELVSTAYGRAVIAKIGLILVIVAFGAFNRKRSVPAAATDLRPLRRTSKGELLVAAGALATAAVLGTVSPPAAGRPPPPRIDVSAQDAAATVRARLTAASDQPGPNRFVVRAVDDDTDQPVRADRVSLRFTPVDDPGVPSTALTLARDPDGSYAGSGANLTFDGRWRVTVAMERGDHSVQIPLAIETIRSTPQFLSVLRPAGQDPEYTVGIEGTGFVIVRPHPERAGRSTLYVTCVDILREETPTERLVVTLASDDRPTRRQAVRRLGPGRFAVGVELAEGENAIAAVARRRDGARLRATLDLDVPGD
jgi:copper transport protein